uniref:RNase H type-1 domain-containing protein n=1 Tax=Quercus lobata TaxID=97700 RepID=A0A7N2MT20_QUELO
MQLLGAAGIGVVVRDSTGEVLAAMSEIIPLPSSVVVLETLAARRAVVFLKELNLHISIFEGDSEESISAIKNQSIHHPSVVLWVI